MHRRDWIAIALGASIPGSGGMVLGGWAVRPARAQQAGDRHVGPITRMVPRLRGLVTVPAVIAAVKAQNVRYAALTRADIERLDRQWRAEVAASSRPLIDAVMKTEPSRLLAAMQADSKGLITEIFVMDSKGLNVAQSEVTSDYWQGDEAKFQRTFDVEPEAVFVDKVELDESTQEFQAQVSFVLLDPADRAAIGAVTVGISVERLGE